MLATAVAAPRAAALPSKCPLACQWHEDIRLAQRRRAPGRAVCRRCHQQGNGHGAEVGVRCRWSEQLPVQCVVSLQAHEGVEHVPEAGNLQLYTVHSALLRARPCHWKKISLTHEVCSSFMSSSQALCGISSCLPGQSSPDRLRSMVTE